MSPHPVDPRLLVETESTHGFGAVSIMIAAMTLIVIVFDGTLFVLNLQADKPGSGAGPAVLWFAVFGDVAFTLLFLALAPILRFFARRRSMIPYLIASICIPTAGLLFTAAVALVFSR